jgi:hypothetical protein
LRPPSVAPLAAPMPNVINDQVVEVKFVRLSADGRDVPDKARIRVVELAPVVNTTPDQKGEYPGHNLVSDPRRFLRSSEKVRFTLFWSRHKNGIDPSNYDLYDDQILSLVHNGHLAAITGAGGDTTAETFAHMVWDQVSSELPKKKLGFTTKRTSGAGGKLDFNKAMTKVVAEEVHRAEPWFVQTSPTAAFAVYVSTLNKRRKGCATLVGGCTRGGGTFPALDKRDKYNSQYLRFLDGFSLDRINSARVVSAVNKKCGLRVAAVAIDLVEKQWTAALARARNAESPSAHQTRSPVSPPRRNTRFRERMSQIRTRGDKRKFEQVEGRPIVLQGAGAREWRGGLSRPKTSFSARLAAVAHLSTLNEVTVVADPVGAHQDTFNQGTRTGYENKAVFALKTSDIAPPQQGNRERVHKKARGGVLYFPDFGFCSYCEPNVDVEYHVCGRTYHCVSEPKFWRQGRGGGSTEQFCFALCDHPKAAVPDLSWLWF